MTGSEKDQTSLEEIDRGDHSFLKMAKQLEENQAVVELKQNIV
jgi:hypothetical protein